VIYSFCRWLGGTCWSIGLRESIWVYPLVDTAHVLALALFVGLAVMLDLRLLGIALRSIPVSQLFGRVAPWMWMGFAIMLTSGVLLFSSDPVKFHGNVFFRVKLLLLALAGLNAGIFHVTIYRSVAAWDSQIAPPARARVAGALSLLFWASVISAGRLIAYQRF
jgi:hypothetical protein